ncbi:MAG: SDR family NAD(P)-dependent oxidoreductase [Rubrivivax sp.]
MGKGEALGNELGGIGMTGSNQSSKALGRLVEVVLERWGRIDVVVNSAGHGSKGPVLELTDEEWHAGLEVYLLNVIRAARIVTPTMVAHGGGDDEGQYESALEREVGHQADMRIAAEQRVRRLAQLSAKAHDFHAVRRRVAFTPHAAC